MQIVPTLCGQKHPEKRVPFHKNCKNSSITISFSRWIPPPRHKLLHMGILVQILENLTNFYNVYFGSDFANCTNFMWSKTSLEEGPISQKLQKFKHHDFIFKVSTPHPPPPRHKHLHMGHNVVKNIFRRLSHFTKIARKCTFYFSQALIPRAFYTAHLVLIRIWRVLCYAYERITNIGSKFEMWLLIYTAHQNTKIAKIQASRFHFQGEYPPPRINSYTWVTMWSKTSLEEGPISQKLWEKENTHSIFHRPCMIPRIIMHIQHPLGNKERFRQKKNETMSANKLALALILRFWGC